MLPPAGGAIRMVLAYSLFTTSFIFAQYPLPNTGGLSHCQRPLGLTASFDVKLLCFKTTRAYHSTSLRVGHTIRGLDGTSRISPLLEGTAKTLHMLE